MNLTFSKYYSDNYFFYERLNTIVEWYFLKVRLVDCWSQCLKFHLFLLQMIWCLLPWYISWKVGYNDLDDFMLANTYFPTHSPKWSDSEKNQNFRIRPKVHLVFLGIRFGTHQFINALQRCSRPRIFDQDSRFEWRQRLIKIACNINLGHLRLCLEFVLYCVDKCIFIQLDFN